jgi:hypothetical protein
MDASIVGDLLSIVLCLFISFAGILASVGAFVYDRRRRAAKSKARTSTGADLGLGPLGTHGGQDRVGGSRNGCEWVVGWEVRRVAGTPPKFVTFFEASSPSIPPAEVRFATDLTSDMTPTGPAHHAVFDENFTAAGDIKIDAVLADEFVSLLRLCDDFYLLPGRITMVCIGDHKETEYLRARLEAVERLTSRLT